MSLQERTLVLKNFDPDKTTPKLLEELCIQAGPVRNVFVKPDHAYVEYEDIESVGYAKALLDGISLHKRKLIFEPKVRNDISMKYTQILKNYINYDKNQRAIQQQQQQQQQHQQMMTAYYQQQQQLQQAFPQQLQQPPPFNPTIQFPVNFVNNQVPNPQIFTTATNPMISQPIFDPQQHQNPIIFNNTRPVHLNFQVPAPPQPHIQPQPQPSTSFKNSNNIGRSNSFNHRHQNNNDNNFKRQRSGNWPRR